MADGKKSAQRLMEEHVRSERAKAWKAAAAVAALAAVGGLGWCFLKEPPPAAPTAQQIMDEKAREAREDPAAAMAGRLPPAVPGRYDPKALVVLKGKQKPPSSGVGMRQPIPAPPAEKSVAPLRAPSPEMIAKLVGSNGKTPLAVDGQGWAVLPDGSKVKVSPAPSNASNPSVAKALAAKAAADAAALAQQKAKEAPRPVDGNGNPIPVTVDEILAQRSWSAHAKQMGGANAAPAKLESARPAPQAIGVEH